MRRSRVSRRILGLMVGAVLFVLLGSFGLLGSVSGAGSVISTPFASAISRAGQSFAGWWEALSAVGSLAKENQQLRKENAALKERLSQDTEIRAQNEELRRQLNVGSVQTENLIATEVIGYQPDNFRQFITIGRGQKDGIRPGMAVVSQGSLVGLVQDVSPSTSKVFLIIDPNFRVTAIDQDSPNRPTGTIRGQIGSGLVMDKVAQSEEIKPGDVVVTSGVGSEIPKGLIIGRIQTVDRRDNGVFQTAQVTSDIQFNRLEVVYVVVRP